MPLPTRSANPTARIAACSVDAIGVAIAPCYFQFAASATTTDATRIWVQLTPAGDFAPRDGRELPVAHWHTDAQTAAATIAAFRANKTPPVIDYEHQTLLAEDNGQPAPAAGRLIDMYWREGQGLFGLIELTPRARQYIADGEYRYFSPVFTYDPESGVVLRIVMGALTNHPALDGMAPVALRAAATARFVSATRNPPREDSMNANCRTPSNIAKSATICRAALHRVPNPEPRVPPPPLPYNPHCAMGDFR